MSKDFESRLVAIELRNKRVEQDKQWETSWARRISISVLTYLVVLVYLVAIDNDSPFVNAFVPPAGFILSTLVMKQARDIWQQKH